MSCWLAVSEASVDPARNIAPKRYPGSVVLGLSLFLALGFHHKSHDYVLGGSQARESNASSGSMDISAQAYMHAEHSHK